MRGKKKEERWKPQGSDKQGLAAADKPRDALNHGERAANKYGGRSV